MFALNMLVIIYVILSTIIILNAKSRKKNEYTMYVFVNLIIIAWESYPLLIQVGPGFLKIICDWSPLFLLPILHRETEILTSAFNKDHYDTLLIQMEKKYFPSVMNFHLNNSANSKLLSEFLHFCYLSFYVLIYGVPLFFYMRHEYAAFYACQFVILFLLFSCSITHSIIPVCGP